MDEMKAFERQVDKELHAMVGPVPHFDAVEIAETAVAARRPSRLRWLRPLEAIGLAAAATLIAAVGVGLFDWLTPKDGPVRIEGKGAYASVSEAVAAAVDGDTVRIAEGVYEEQVRVEAAIEIKGEGEVVFRVTSDGPAFRLREADAVINGIDFLSLAPAGDGNRRPAIDIDGGTPVLENLVMTADAPEEYDFIRIDDTGEGAVIRDSRSSGWIRANRGAQVLIEGNVLLSEDPDAPPTGIEASRGDTFLHISGNELNTISLILGARAEVVGNDIHHPGPPLVMTMSGSGDASLGGSCGVAAYAEEPVVLSDNHIHDSGTGICGRVEVRGGLIEGNEVGVWTGWNASVIGAEIRDNGVGVQLEAGAEATLTDVVFCGNGVDIEADETAPVAQNGTSECAP